QGGQWTEADDIAPASKAASTSQPKEDRNEEKAVNGSAPARPKKLSYKLQKEFDELPQKIEQLEQQLGELQEVVSAPEFYQNTPDLVEQQLQALAQVEQQLESCFERWAELEDMQHNP